MVTALTHDTWESAIRDAWSAVRNRVEVTRDLGIATCARGRSHAILTDIICWTDLEFRVAVEVKAPVRSEEGSNSAMTHGRMAFYKDIDRLRYVVGSTSTKVKRGMFLAVVNELGYVTHRQQRKNLDYNTFHETTVQGGAVLAATEGRNGCPYPLEKLSVLMHRTRQVVLGCLAAVFLIFASSSTALAAPMDYVAFETFAAWITLVPEGNRPLFCGLTPAAHDMWAQGSLRMPADGFMRGDVTGTGRDDWIIPLTIDKEGKGCTHLLIVTRTQQGWLRLFFSRIQKLNPGGSYGVLLSQKKHAVAVDLGDRERVTRPATLTWQNGKVIESSPGFVIEKTKIWEYATWNPSDNLYDYVYLAKPEEWEIEQD